MRSMAPRTMALARYNNIYAVRPIRLCNRKPFPHEYGWRLAFVRMARQKNIVGLTPGRESFAPG